MGSSAPTPHNWSFQAIPAAFALALVPHGYFMVLGAATAKKMSLAMPRSNLDAWKSKVPADVWGQLSRARGAHLNAMEVFPLFAAAMVAGNVAGIPAQDMNNMAFSFFAARILYTGFYIAVKNDKLAFARTGLYSWSIGVPMLCLWKAGKIMSGTS